MKFNCLNLRAIFFHIIVNIIIHINCSNFFSRNILTNSTSLETNNNLNDNGTIWTIELGQKKIEKEKNSKKFYLSKSEIISIPPGETCLDKNKIKMKNKMRKNPNENNPKINSDKNNTKNNNKNRNSNNINKRNKYKSTNKLKRNIPFIRKNISDKNFSFYNNKTTEKRLKGYQDNEINNNNNNNNDIFKEDKGENLNIFSGFDPDYLFDSDEDNSKTTKKKNGGYMGFCLIKYKNHFINLHKIKDEGGNFYLKFHDDIIEFSLCRDLYSYDEKKHGLFLDRVNNNLFAGTKDEEKIFRFVDAENKDEEKTYTSDYFNLGKKNNDKNYDYNSKNEENEDSDDSKIDYSSNFEKINKGNNDKYFNSLFGNLLNYNNFYANNSTNNNNNKNNHKHKSQKIWYDNNNDDRNDNDNDNNNKDNGKNYNNNSNKYNSKKENYNYNNNNGNNYNNNNNNNNNNDKTENDNNSNNNNNPNDNNSNYNNNDSNNKINKKNNNSNRPINIWNKNNNNNKNNNDNSQINDILNDRKSTSNQNSKNSKTSNKLKDSINTKNNTKINNTKNPKNFRKLSTKNQKNNNKHLAANETKLFDKIHLYLPYGDVCHRDPYSDKEYRYTILYELICDERADLPVVYGRDTFDPANCFNKLRIKTKYVCQKNLRKFVPWFERFLINKQILSLICIFIGSYLLFFGRVNMNLSFFFSIVVLSYLFCCSMNYIDGQANAQNIVGLSLIPFLALVIFPSIILQHITFRLVAALTLYDFFFCLTGKFILQNNWMDFDAYNITTLSVFIMAMILSTFIIQTHEVYGQMAFSGSFIFVKGVSISHGNFPERQYIKLLLKHGEFIQYNRTFSRDIGIYLFVLIFLWCAGYYIQKFMGSGFLNDLGIQVDNPEDENDDNDNHEKTKLRNKGYNYRNRRDRDNNNNNRDNRDNRDNRENRENRDNSNRSVDNQRKRSIKFVKTAKDKRNEENEIDNNQSQSLRGSISKNNNNNSNNQISNSPLNKNNSDFNINRSASMKNNNNSNNNRSGIFLDDDDIVPKKKRRMNLDDDEDENINHSALNDYKEKEKDSKEKELEKLKKEKLEILAKKEREKKLEEEKMEQKIKEMEQERQQKKELMLEIERLKEEEKKREIEREEERQKIKELEKNMDSEKKRYSDLFESKETSGFKPLNNNNFIRDNIIKENSNENYEGNGTSKGDINHNENNDNKYHEIYTHGDNHYINDNDNNDNNEIEKYSLIDKKTSSMNNLGTLGDGNNYFQFTKNDNNNENNAHKIFNSNNRYTQFDFESNNSNNNQNNQSNLNLNKEEDLYYNKSNSTIKEEIKEAKEGKDGRRSTGNFTANFNESNNNLNNTNIINQSNNNSIMNNNNFNDESLFTLKDRNLETEKNLRENEKEIIKLDDNENISSKKIEEKINIKNNIDIKSNINNNDLDNNKEKIAEISKENIGLDSASTIKTKKKKSTKPRSSSKQAVLSLLNFNPIADEEENNESFNIDNKKTPKSKKKSKSGQSGKSKSKSKDKIKEEKKESELNFDYSDINNMNTISKNPMNKSKQVSNINDIMNEGGNIFG